MNICIHGWPVNECQVKTCPSRGVQQPGPDVSPLATLIGGPAPQEMGGHKLIPIPDKPEITDPAAKNAMELSAALEESAMLKEAVANLEKLLSGAKQKLKQSEVTCKEKLRLLSGAPEKKRKEKIAAFEYKEPTNPSAKT